DPTSGRNFPSVATAQDAASRTAAAALSNGQAGLLINSSNNRVGGNNPGLRNVIENNFRDVVIQRDLTAPIPSQSGTGNLLQNNFILDATEEGVYVTASNNTIGEALQGGGNVISGNGTVGVHVANVAGQPDVQGNNLLGNEIGTDIGTLSPSYPRGAFP